VRSTCGRTLTISPKRNDPISERWNVEQIYPLL
jgi:hypothetical protein